MVGREMRHEGVVVFSPTAAKPPPPTLPSVLPLLVPIHACAKGRCCGHSLLHSRFLPLDRMENDRGRGCVYVDAFNCDEIYATES